MIDGNLLGVHIQMNCIMVMSSDHNLPYWDFRIENSRS